MWCINWPHSIWLLSFGMISPQNIFLLWLLWQYTLLLSNSFRLVSYSVSIFQLPFKCGCISVLQHNTFTLSTAHSLVVVQSFSHVQLFATPWTVTHQASMSFTISQTLHTLSRTSIIHPSYAFSYHSNISNSHIGIFWQHLPQTHVHIPLPSPTPHV